MMKKIIILSWISLMTMQAGEEPFIGDPVIIEEGIPLLTVENIKFVKDMMPRADGTLKGMLKRAIKDLYKQCYEQGCTDLLAWEQPLAKDWAAAEGIARAEKFFADVDKQARSNRLVVEKGAFKEFVKAFQGKSYYDIYKEIKNASKYKYKDTVENLLKNKKYLEAAQYRQTDLVSLEENELFVSVLDHLKDLFDKNIIDVLTRVNRFFKDKDFTIIATYEEILKPNIVALLTLEIFTISQLDVLVSNHYGRKGEKYFNTLLQELLLNKSLVHDKSSSAYIDPSKSLYEYIESLRTPEGARIYQQRLNVLEEPKNKEERNKVLNYIKQMWYLAQGRPVDRVFESMKTYINQYFSSYSPEDFVKELHDFPVNKPGTTQPIEITFTQQDFQNIKNYGERSKY